MKYAIIISGEYKYIDKDKALSELYAIIHRYNANILATVHEEFEGKKLMYIIINASDSKTSVRELSNMLWLKGNDMRYKTHLKESR